MICLGIESTAHTISIGIMDDKGNILGEASHVLETKQGGIIPDKARDHHLEWKDKVLEKALGDLSFDEINVISFSQGPGLPLSLHVGKNFAVLLAKKYNKPLVGVSHLVAHLEIGKLLTGSKDPVFVFVSGANTQIIVHEGDRFRILGEALSVGLGNAIDKFGRVIGIGFPAGAKVEEIAEKGKYVELPYVVKGMDVEFSGIVTKCKQLYEKGVTKEDLCYSLQQVGFAMLVEVTERALAHCNKKEVIVIGGVAANKVLSKMMDSMCEDRNAMFYACPVKYCGDNGVMISWLGLLQYKVDYNVLNLDNVTVNPKWRIDAVETKWVEN